MVCIEYSLHSGGLGSHSLYISWSQFRGAQVLWRTQAGQLQLRWGIYTHLTPSFILCHKNTFWYMSWRCVCVNRSVCPICVGTMGL